MHYKVSSFILAALLLAASPAQADDAIKAVLSAPTIRVADVVLDKNALTAAYPAPDFSPLWVERGQLTKQGQALATVLAGADRHGLQVADYHVKEIADRIQATDHSELMVLDLLLTDGLMRYAVDLRVGRISPRQLPGEKYQKSQSLDPVAVVTEARRAPDIAAYLAGLAPKSPAYAGLVDLLADLRAEAVKGPWPTLPDGPKLDPGVVSKRIPALRARLAASNDLGQAEAGEGTTYDPALVEAVKVFQQRAGLKADGIVGRATRAALNTSLETRINQVLANLERLRWQPDDLGARHVLVNVPAYHLTAITPGQPPLEMAVIVGRDERKTPLFSDLIRYLEFNPNWHVPPTIVREDILPHLPTNPNYAKEEKNVFIFQDGVEVDPATVDWKTANPRDFRFRAPPGPRNPLGTVKFMFPNRFDVYLHDTSEPKKFQEDVRALSSGCIRVADPVALTNWLLSDKEKWSEEKRQQILASAKQTRVDMQNLVPVHLVYQTAWRGADGRPVFREDIYGYDAALVAELDRVKASPRRMTATMATATTTTPPSSPLDDLTQPVPVAAP